MPHRSPVCVNILPRRSAETRAVIEARRSDELYTPIPAHRAAADPAPRGG
jgi:hypothetical protein